MAAPQPAASISSIGIPREIKPDEQRVALTPDAVRELVSIGLEVRIEQGAGQGAGIDDASFAAAGAALVSKEEAWAAHLVVKVKEPQPEEFGFLRRDMVLFTYLHLAAYPAVGQALLESGCTNRLRNGAVENGSLLLLAPMSEIAGRLATQVGAYLLDVPMAVGVLLGGCTGVKPARVVVLGAGTGWNAPASQQPWMPEMLLDRPSGCAIWRPTGADAWQLVSSRGLIERVIPPLIC